MHKIGVRRAVEADAERIVELHYAAVHRTASAFYPAEILDRWSSPPGEGRWKFTRQAIASEDEVILAAEIEGVICGFGVVVPANEELRALYVHPDFGGRGVGSAILLRLEGIASERGVKRLQLDSSLNAEGFYRKHGYVVLGYGVHKLTGGVEMPCVKMTRALSHREV